MGRASLGALVATVALTSRQRARSRVRGTARHSEAARVPYRDQRSSRDIGDGRRTLRATVCRGITAAAITGRDVTPRVLAGATVATLVQTDSTNDLPGEWSRTEITLALRSLSAPPIPIATTCRSDARAARFRAPRMPHSSWIQLDTHIVTTSTAFRDRTTPPGGPHGQLSCTPPDRRTSDVTAGPPNWRKGRIPRACKDDCS